MANPSSALLPRAVTQATLPPGESTTRTGLAPAPATARPAVAGSRCAAAMPMTRTTPGSQSGSPGQRRLVTGPRRPPAGRRSSLVTYSQRPSGETASPTGASGTGTRPTRTPLARKPADRARARSETCTAPVPSSEVNAKRPSAEVVTSMAPPGAVRLPVTSGAEPDSRRATLSTHGLTRRRHQQVAPVRGQRLTQALLAAGQRNRSHHPGRGGRGSGAQDGDPAAVADEDPPPVRLT